MSIDISIERTGIPVERRERVSCSIMSLARYVVCWTLEQGTGGCLRFSGSAARTRLGSASITPEAMLDAGRQRFGEDDRVELVKHDLAEPLPALGRFEVVVSSMAIHHLEHERKRSLYAEVFELLEPGGLFANFEHVASPTRRLHLAFFAAIGESLENEDPSDRLLDVETQLGWLRSIGFEDVDCNWKWLEMALLIGIKPSPQQQ